MNHTLQGFALMGSILLAGIGPASAQNFNQGIPTTWTCEGHCGTLAADGDVEPPLVGASRYGYISNDRGVEDIYLPWEATRSVPAETGSRLRTKSFTVPAGTTISFYFNYVTSGGWWDYAWVRLLDSTVVPTGTRALLLTTRTVPVEWTDEAPYVPTGVATLNAGQGRTTNKQVFWSPLGYDSGICYSSTCGLTGWIKATYVVPKSGTYKLEFGVVQWENYIANSGLAVDGIKVGGTLLGR